MKSEAEMLDKYFFFNGKVIRKVDPHMELRNYIEFEIVYKYK